MEFKNWLIEENAKLIQPVVWAAMQYVANQLGVPEGIGEEYYQKVAEYVAKKLNIGVEQALLYVRCNVLKSKQACWTLRGA